MSSPFLHLRELLKELDFRDTPLNLAADLCEHLKKYLGTRHELLEYWRQAIILLVKYALILAYNDNVRIALSNIDSKRIYIYSFVILPIPNAETFRTITSALVGAKIIKDVKMKIRKSAQFCSNSFKMSQDACWECAMAIKIRHESQTTFFSIVVNNSEALHAMHVRINSEEAANLEESLLLIFFEKISTALLLLVIPNLIWEISLMKRLTAIIIRYILAFWKVALSVFSRKFAK
ncbi:hypothetical protein HN51_051820, partial [Arachis hypogaea]